MNVRILNQRLNANEFLELIECSEVQTTLGGVGHSIALKLFQDGKISKLKAQDCASIVWTKKK